ncbi:rhodanese-like domain-containing protein [Kribbella sp. NPDC003557]|uniref:sulfurtransferase n=1 Tax=Kribbella sp. NPDC003557 TaxID=3154449 RepID=UPI0033B26BB6
MTPLISVDELRALDPRPVLVDVTWNLAGPPGKEAYDAGHLPGAHFVDLDTELAAPPGPGRHPLPTATTVTATFARLGITTPDTPVVVYDAANSTAAARAWWTFRYFGLTNVRVLNGGKAAWQSTGGNLTTEPPPEPTQASATGATTDSPAGAGTGSPAGATTGSAAGAGTGSAAGATPGSAAGAGSGSAAGAGTGSPAGVTAGSAAGAGTGSPAGVTAGSAAGATAESPAGSGAAGTTDFLADSTGAPAPNTAGGDRTTSDVPGGLIATPGHIPVLDADGAAAVAAKGVLLDARAPERFAGEVEPMDPVAGHIPGAVNAPTTANVDETGHFLPADDLRARFAALGVTAEAEVGVYCGSGVTAAHEALALEAAGIPATVYIGSWSEWITDPTRPVATGND